MIVGDKVVYPCQGPCLIDTVVLKTASGGRKCFYHLIVLIDSGGELFVPVDKAEAIRIRPLLKESEIPKLIGQLITTAKIAKDRKHRAQDLLELFTSGSALLPILWQTPSGRAMGLADVREIELKDIICKSAKHKWNLNR